MQFREFLAVLGSRWKTVVVSLLLVLSATVAATLRIQPTYEATTQVFFAADSTKPGGYTLTTDDLGTFQRLVDSPVVMGPLRDSLKPAPGTSLTVTAAVTDGSPMLDISARSSSATTAAAAANAVGPELASIGRDFVPGLLATGQNVKATTITPAEVPSRPVAPNLVQNVALGLLAGLALGIGLAMLRQFLDTRVRSERDVRAVSDRPILGALRLLPKGTDAGTLMTDDPHGVPAEEYRRLRTNLQFADVTTGGKHSFVITSVMPGDGKTTTSVNLAIALADSGARVLLVDGDLRNPSVATALGLEGNVGLTTVLLGRTTVAQAAQQWGDSTLQVLPSGAIPPNPSELLGSTAMAALFEELLAAYDYVLVDSPPVLPVIDPVLIDRLVGGMLVVVGVNCTLKRDLAQAVRQLQTVDATVAGFALNRVPNDDAGRYGSYYAYGRGKKDRRRREAVASRNGSLEEAVPVTPAAIPGLSGPSDGDEHQAARTPQGAPYAPPQSDSHFARPQGILRPLPAPPAPTTSEDMDDTAINAVVPPTTQPSHGRRFTD